MTFLVRLQIYSLLLLMFSLMGCGEKTVTASPTSRADSAENCITCHQSSTNRVTGKIIYEEWKLSSHNLKNAAGCADCHEPDAGHPTSCNLCHSGTPTGSLATSVTHNPDLAGKCTKCHTKNAGFSTSLRAHFNNITSGAYPASYVSSKYEKNCRACHDPHDTTKNMSYLQDWAKSGHGRTTAGPWVEFDFKMSVYGDTYCNRCHTTTGYIKFVTTGDSAPWGVSTDKTKENLMCNGCHTDYNFRMRSVPAVTLSAATPPYSSTDSSVTYPDAKSSNLCINCHSGHAIGDSIKSITDFSNATFVDSHYLDAAGIVFAKSGYHYTNRSYSFDPKEDIHYKLGMGVTTGKAGFDAIQGNYSEGPCVTCHLTSKSGTHTFKATTVYSATDTSLNPICGTTDCHPNRVPISINPISTGGASPNAYTTWLGDKITSDPTKGGTTNKAQYQAALIALKEQLTKRNFIYNGDAHPVFAQTVWGNANNMGAAFNYRMLLKDRGGVAHNRRYTKRLIYDSIDWLDNNTMDDSVYLTLNTISDAGVKAQAIRYLIKTTKDPITNTNIYGRN